MASATVEFVQPAPDAPALQPVTGGMDPESRQWIDDLRAKGASRNDALVRLHGLLLAASRFEINRRRLSLPHLRGDDLDDLAHQSADDAMLAILRKLDDFRGDSRFTTWAYKFALLEAAVKLRRRSWQGRELPLAAEGWEHLVADDPTPHGTVESGELLGAIRDGIAALTPHQREVLVTTVLNGVPIDVLAERLDTTRGALYKTLHDARRKLRAHLEQTGLDRSGDSND
jgi:RNA polymerase sigma-70 factor (ECF subfamily)